MAHINTIGQDVKRLSNVSISLASVLPQAHQNSQTFYLNYEGPLPPRGSKQCKVDLTIEETLVYPLEERPVLRAYEEFDDLPTDAMVSVYSLKEVVLEKLAAVTDKARTQPRDLYDLWYLFEGGYIDLNELEAGVAKTSQANVAIWQDVYHVPLEEIVLYVKFTTDSLGYLLISFKDKDAP